MAALSARDIEMIARQIAQQLGGGAPSPAPAPAARAEPAAAQPELGVYAGIDDAVKAAQQAFPKYAALSLGGRGKIIAAIRKTMLENAIKIDFSSERARLSPSRRYCCRCRCRCCHWLHLRQSASSSPRKRLSARGRGSSRRRRGYGGTRG